MSIGKADLAASLQAVSIGESATVPNGYLDDFFQEGWVEAVRVGTEEVVDRDHPKAVIRLTKAGWDRMQSK